MRPQSRELPAKAVSAVLGEIERACAAKQKARVDVPALGTGVLLLGATTLSAIVVALLATIGKHGALGVTVSGRDRLVAGIGLRPLRLASISTVEVAAIFSDPKGLLNYVLGKEQKAR
jgi:hypothetical protein